MDDTLAAQLLTAIEGNRLVILCGAGLSMPPPSNLPPASKLAQECADKYKHITGDSLPADHQTDLEKLSKFFNDKKELQATLLKLLVDWSPFLGNPNAGHEAIADFLACRAFEVGVTTNYDILVEKAAIGLGEPDFRATVEKDDINNGVIPHSPFLKIHGCAQRNRWHTVWCIDQISKEPLLSLLAAFQAWMVSNLQQRDLILLGFWSDWDYLNAVFSTAVVGTEPRNIIVVDPADAATLERKAPDLWKWAHSGHVTFLHVQERSEVFLAELRSRFSRTFLNRVVNDARSDFDAHFGPTLPTIGVIPDSIGLADLYGRRRAFCGEPVTAPVRTKRPEADQKLVGIVHLLLCKEGATFDGSHYKLNGKRLRIFKSNGQFLSSVKAKLNHEPPNVEPVDRIICVGASDDGGAPAHIVRSSAVGSIIRGGTAAEWITHEALFAEHRSKP